ncbi:phosphotriesterase family protein [Salinibacillus xinjiangensis]|uniref:Phosphotriesterase-related protein n=1 Tax=Salinibacillus xinjiangensis TaxID=1229268 RepID=A0A6G1XAY4_9BACI|nr:phosphotriesterase-related protein [Salinibacillus xinjiangensis]MRG88144.1 phosphotriesterase-related protein [Salinibacillus xinjiangensis]
MSTVETVQGPIPAEDLGITLMHEHLFVDRTRLWRDPVGPKKKFAQRKVEMDILGQLRLDPYSNYDNTLMIDIDLACKEVKHFFNKGGGTLVDVTNVGVGRDPHALLEVSRRTSLNIVMGAGYYLHPTIPTEVQYMSIDEIKEGIVKDLTVGVDDTGIKAGIIGEIGIGPNMTDLEVKVLRGAARAQKETGKTLTIHTPAWERYCHDILDVVEEEGGNLERTILDHMNPSMDDMDYQSSLVKRGCYIEYDMIGIEVLFPGEGQSPSDEDNANAIVRLLEKGLGNKVLLSQDIFLKMFLKTYGGYGYSHILENFVPRLRKKGVSEQEVQNLLVENPKRCLISE